MEWKWDSPTKEKQLNGGNGKEQEQEKKNVVLLVSDGRRLPATITSDCGYAGIKCLGAGGRHGVHVQDKPGGVLGQGLAVWLFGCLAVLGKRYATAAASPANRWRCRSGTVVPGWPALVRIRKMTLLGVEDPPLHQQSASIIPSPTLLLLSIYRFPYSLKRTQRPLEYCLGIAFAKYQNCLLPEISCSSQDLLTGHRSRTRRSRGSW